METRFITLSVALQPSPPALSAAIEAALKCQGWPLRWAITAWDQTRQTVQVEAIVTSSPELHPHQI